MSMEMRKFLAPEFVFGVNARLLVARHARTFRARKALLVTDHGVWNAGWAQEAATLLDEQGIQTYITQSVSPNPRDHEVMAGAELYKAQDCDILVAVGGGSVIDAAKGMGIVISNRGNIVDYRGVDRVPLPMPPLICIPTTAGTAADVSQFAIINHTAERVKIAIISKSVVPDVALVDPVPLTTMDATLTACTGMDALVHGVEAYVSNASSALTDIHALEAVRLVIQHLEACVKEPSNLEHRTGMMMASLQAGLAFSNASLGSVHAMAHSLGGYSDLPHGECNALLLPHVVEYNFQAAPDRYRRLGEALGLDFRGLNARQTEKRLVDALFNLRSRVGIKPHLKDRGIRREDLSILAEKAINDPCNATNPRAPEVRDLEVIYSEAF